jgi:hypothetical protein
VNKREEIDNIKRKYVKSERKTRASRRKISLFYLQEDKFPSFLSFYEAMTDPPF